PVVLTGCALRPAVNGGGTRNAKHPALAAELIELLVVVLGAHGSGREQALRGLPVCRRAVVQRQERRPHFPGRRVALTPLKKRRTVSVQPRHEKGGPVVSEVRADRQVGVGARGTAGGSASG